MPVSDATLSASPSKPQLQCGRGCPGSRRPCIGTCTWPSSPAKPAAPLTTCPFSMTPPAESGADDRGDRPALRRERGRRAGSARRGRRRCRRCCRRQAAPAAPRGRRGSRSCASPGGRSSWSPRDEMTPSALAGPGVSRPTARTRSRAMPVRRRTSSNERTRASIATSGPSVTRLGLSRSSSTRKRPEASRTVALFLLPPLSSPTTTQPSVCIEAPFPEAGILV